MIEILMRYKLIVLFIITLIVGYGIYSYKTLPIDTFPDPTPVQVNIYTEAPGLSAEEIEFLVSKKVEMVMSGIKDVENIRSVTLPGLSYVSIFFKDGTDIYFARRLVMEKMNDLQAILPPSFKPVMGPNSSGLGNVLIYVVKGNKPLTDLKTIEEWKIKPIIKSVSGVEEISQWGPDKAFLVLPNPDKLIAYNLSYEDIIQSVSQNGNIAGGGFTQTPYGNLIIRGVGAISSIEDIKNIPVFVKDGSVIKLSEVADIIDGEVPNRRGAFTLNGEEVQGNIILKRVNTNTKELVEKLKEKINQINTILPKGVNIEILYDQSFLTKKAVSTIEKALFEGIILVSIAMLIYLGNIRAAILVILSIPFTLLIAFSIMKNIGISGNLMSLAGLAIGIGLFADATVVVVENTFRHLSERDEEKEKIIIDSVKEIAKPVIFAILIIIAVFLPIFSFESVEGKYYKPLAITIISALIASLFVAFILMPVLSYFLLKHQNEEETKIIKFIIEKHQNLLDRLFNYPKIVISTVVVAFFISLFLLSRIGTEFAPQLDEGAILVKSFLNPNVSLEEAKQVANFVEKTAKSHPQVINAFSNIGRAEKGEPEDISYIETFITLKPYNKWNSDIKTRAELENILRKELEKFPGVSFSFTQPIQMRIDELLSGVKSTVAIKIFGDDLDKINKIAYQIEDIVKNTKGAVDVETEAQSGKLQLRIKPKYENLYRYNLTVNDLISFIGKLFAGEEANILKQELITFPIIVKIPDKYLSNIEDIKNLPITTKEGALLKLSDIADIEVAEGFFKIRHENGMRFALVQSNLEGRDLGSFINELKQKIHSQIKLPEGYFIQFAGQFENQERAMKKLSIIVPIVIGLIFLLLFINFGSVRDSLIVLLNIPFATIGGIIALYISGFNLSVPAAIGFIAVFGIATLNGVVLISYIRDIASKEKDINNIIKKATALRIRPILITATAASLGLVPILLTSDIGSETQKPIATVVIGGIFSSTLLTLIVLPVVYKYFGEKASKKA